MPQIEAKTAPKTMPRTAAQSEAQIEAQNIQQETIKPWHKKIKSNKQIKRSDDILSDVPLLVSWSSALGDLDELALGKRSSIQTFMFLSQAGTESDYWSRNFGHQANFYFDVVKERKLRI